MSTVATIRARDLGLVLAAAKLRRWNNGRTCQLCALSEHPTIALDCHYPGSKSSSYREAASRHGISPARVWPMQRGRIARLFERVQRVHGRREVLRTWGVGIRALKAEPAHVLNGGAE